MKSYGVLWFVSDPELTKVGDTVKSSFKLMYKNKRYNNEGVLVKEVNYLDFEVWDSAAEFVVKNCIKGDSIYVEATPKQESWEVNGETRSKIVFRIDSFRVFN